MEQYCQVTVIKCRRARGFFRRSCFSWTFQPVITCLSRGRLLLSVDYYAYAVRSRIAAYCKIRVCCVDTLHCVRNCVTRAMYLANCKIWESTGNVRKGHSYTPQVDFRKKCILRGNYLRCHFYTREFMNIYIYIFHKYLKICFLREVDLRFKFLEWKINDGDKCIILIIFNENFWRKFCLLLKIYFIRKYNYTVYLFCEKI